MSARLEIHDGTANNTLTFDMKDVLRVLPAWARNLDWYVLDLEATGEPRSGEESVMALEHKMRSSKHGLKLTWGKLQEVADRLTQTINAVIVGLSPGQPAPSLPPQSEYRGRFIVIEAIDSSLWAVTSNDASVIDRLRQHFRDTKLVPGAA